MQWKSPSATEAFVKESRQWPYSHGVDAHSFVSTARSQIMTLYISSQNSRLRSLTTLSVVVTVHSTLFKLGSVGSFSTRRSASRIQKGMALTPGAPVYIYTEWVEPTNSRFELGGGSHGRSAGQSGQ